MTGIEWLPRPRPFNMLHRVIIDMEGGALLQIIQQWMCLHPKTLKPLNPPPASGPALPALRSLQTFTRTSLMHTSDVSTYRMHTCQTKHECRGSL